jgi:hypothetical protein
MRNLVYLIGLPNYLISKESLQSTYFFGQFGPIKKLILNNNSKKNGGNNSAYVTFESDISAAMAILTIDGINFKNKFFKASFGMTKYCSFFLKGDKCPKKECLFLHRKANQEDIVTVKDQVSQKVHVTMTNEDVVEYCLSLGANQIKQFELSYKEVYSKEDEYSYQYKSWAAVIPSVQKTIDYIKKQFENKFKKSVYEKSTIKKKKKTSKIKSIKSSKKKTMLQKW